MRLLVAVLATVAGAVHHPRVFEPPCLYPSVVISTSSGFLNVDQGRFYPLPCPHVAHPRHRLVVVRAGGAVIVRMVP